MTVEENLEMGGLSAIMILAIRSQRFMICFLFYEKTSSACWRIIGGHDNRSPWDVPSRLSQALMLDEPTAGVSLIMDDLFDRIIDVARTGIAILIVEQNAKQALTIADRGYVMVQGENRYTDTGAALLENPDVRRAFLGG